MTRPKRMKITVAFAVTAMATALAGCSGPSEAEIEAFVQQSFDQNLMAMMTMGGQGTDGFQPSSMIESVRRHGCDRVVGGYVCVVGVKFAEPFARSMALMLDANGVYTARYQFTRTDDGWYGDEILN